MEKIRRAVILIDSSETVSVISILSPLNAVLFLDGPQYILLSWTMCQTTDEKWTQNISLHYGIYVALLT